MSKHEPDDDDKDILVTDPKNLKGFLQEVGMEYSFTNVDDDDGGHTDYKTQDKLLDEAVIKLKSFIAQENKKAEVIGIEKGRKLAWQEMRRKAYEAGEVVGYYEILEKTDVKKSGNRVFRVKCIVCEVAMKRYSNRFYKKHMFCLEEPKFSERLVELKTPSGDSK